MLALSFSVFAQQRSIQKKYDGYSYDNYQRNDREVGRYQNDSYRYSYKSNGHKDRGLQLTSYQERKLDELMSKMHKEIRLAQRVQGNPVYKIRKIEREYDQKIARLLTKKQYNKFVKMYAYEYSGFGYARV